MEGLRSLDCISRGSSEAIHGEKRPFKMSDLAETMEMDEWLGVAKGKNRNRRCRTAVKESLVRGRANGLFDMGDVPEHGATMTEALRAYWRQIFEAMRDQGEEEDNHLGGGGGAYLAFLVWVETPMDVEEDVGMAAVTERDCAAQGAESQKDIARLCVGMHLARWPSAEDCKGMGHGAPPQNSLAAKAAVKAKTPTWDTAMAQSKKEGTLNPLEIHISRMLGQWSMSTDKFAIKASYLFNKWWMGVKRANNNDVDAILGYLTEYFSLYAGRGLPVEHDGQIQSAISAKRMSAVLNGEFKSWAAGKKKEEEGITLEDLAKQMSAIMTLAQTTANKVETMRSGKEDRRLPVEDRKCFHCGEMGHQYAACPKRE
jgi:hypothetical protein